ncbi:ABC-2 type transport system ATP-binding protein [Granulicatella balaenopterae]|uniref:ABC-2 type transport system ATP-binding protein n=1 Tax=Granulicatella balaenopterae TaxID=137733 RepID=A0A1H9HNT8_9LACT|nr:ABC transporter ATP-binding protein [Granulicatella balaenopterae]SEQ63958.1 ABC-2 type transport system ATP-binding protein [Granulicatella balaenopterae]
MLEVKNVHKSFGSLKAVNDLSFSIKENEILGMIGRNGSGKTTTFRLILDFLTPDKGEVLWNNHPLTSEDYDAIGYLPEERGLYPKVTIQEQILYFAKLRGKKAKDILPKIDYWMEKFQVKGKKTDKIKTLSKGNQQKVQLITTLIHEPKLVILDEPFSGLDPVNAALLKEAIMELKQKGACVIFSSHNMENVAEICDSLVMIHNGDQVLEGEVDDIRLSFGRTKLIVEADVTDEELLAIPGVISIESLPLNQKLLQLEHEEVGREVFKLVAKDGYVPVFNQQPPTLEEIFKMKAGGKDE